MFANAANDLATWFALGGAIPAALGLFTFVLGRPRTWWRSFTGWSIAILLFSITLIFTLVLVRRLGGITEGFAVAAITVYALLMLALWLVFVMIVIERRRGRALGFVPIEKPNNTQVEERKNNG